MSLVICDTNIFISLFRNDPNTVEAVKVIGSANVLIPSITLMELYRGMRDKKEMSEMQKKLSGYNILHFNEDVSKIAVDLIHKFKLSHDLKMPDAIIGAMSSAFELALFTYNTKDFKFMPGVKLYQPIKS